MCSSRYDTANDPNERVSIIEQCTQDAELGRTISTPFHDLHFTGHQF